jgi:hypothetical protein
MIARGDTHVKQQKEGRSLWTALYSSGADHFRRLPIGPVPIRKGLEARAGSTDA